MLRDARTGVSGGNTHVIHGPSAAGTELSVTPDGSDEALTSTIVELVDGEVYADRTEFNGLILIDRHALTPLADGGTRITHQLIIGGPAAATVGSKPWSADQRGLPGRHEQLPDPDESV